ncbi:MAG TPA: hypothetical protein VJA94_12160 [Candidatus Angelobacter sp.]
MAKIVSFILRWTARIAALLIATIFFAFLAGEPTGSLRTIHVRDWVGLVLLFACITAMLVAWKWEFHAALVSLFSLVAFAAVVHMNRYDVLFIAAIPDMLFLIDWELRRFHASHITKSA